MRVVCEGCTEFIRPHEAHESVCKVCIHIMDGAKNMFPDRFHVKYHVVEDGEYVASFAEHSDADDFVLWNRGKKGAGIFGIIEREAVVSE